MSKEEASALQDAVRIMQKRIFALEAALKPFGDALHLHRAYMSNPRKFKDRISLSLGMADWQKVADALGIDLTVKEPQETEEVSQ